MSFFVSVLQIPVSAWLEDIFITVDADVYVYT